MRLLVVPASRFSAAAELLLIMNSEQRSRKPRHPLGVAPSLPCRPHPLLAVSTLAQIARMSAVTPHTGNAWWTLPCMPSFASMLGGGGRAYGGLPVFELAGGEEEHLDPSPRPVARVRRLRRQESSPRSRLSYPYCCRRESQLLER
jgi:hypothetical protein